MRTAPRGVRSASLLALAFAAAALGCGGSTGQVDGARSSHDDAGVAATGAAGAQTGAPDGGAGPADGGSSGGHDGGPDLGGDAGATDAGASDPGGSDAGAADAGATDTGIGSPGAADAGAQDAGASDAGTGDGGGGGTGASDGGTAGSGGPDGGPRVNVVVSVTADHLWPGDSRMYSAAVRDGTSPGYRWSVREGAAGGTVTVTGVYTAPSARGVYHLVATADEDPTASAEIELTVDDDIFDAGGWILPEVHVRPLFWGDRAAFADKVEALASFYPAMDGSGLLAAADEYFRGARGRVRYDGALFDASPSPAPAVPVTPYLLQGEICGALAAAGLAPDPLGYVPVYTTTRSDALPPSLGAWHAYATCAGTTFAIAYVPTSPQFTFGGCAYPPETGYALAVSAHELLEAMTDPNVDWGRGAWRDAHDGEIADRCGYVCIDLHGTPSPGTMIWSARRRTCVAR